MVYKLIKGHVSRNIRICLSIIDLAAPYINLFKV